MVLINPSAPQPNGPDSNKPKPKPKPMPKNTPPAATPHDPHGNSLLPKDNKFHGGQGWESFKKWLGPKGYKQFQTTLCKNISQQINKQKQKEQKRKEMMLKSIKGEDIYDGT